MTGHWYTTKNTTVGGVMPFILLQLLRLYSVLTILNVPVRSFLLYFFLHPLVHFLSFISFGDVDQLTLTPAPTG